MPPTPFCTQPAPKSCTRVSPFYKGTYEAQLVIRWNFTRERQYRNFEAVPLNKAKDGFDEISSSRRVKYLKFDDNGDDDDG